MKASLNELHAAISAIAALDKAGITKTSLEVIPEIPEKNWSILKNQLYANTVRVNMMAVSPISFAVFAADSDRAGFRFFNALALLVPIVALALSILYSWWWVFLSIGSLFCFKTARLIYRTVIFQGVTASEAAFCFLFSRNTICLVIDGGLVYHKNL